MSAVTQDIGSTDVDGKSFLKVLLHLVNGGPRFLCGIESALMILIWRVMRSLKKMSQLQSVGKLSDVDMLLKASKLLIEKAQT